MVQLCNQRDDDAFNIHPLTSRYLLVTFTAVTVLVTSSEAISRPILPSSSAIKVTVGGIHHPFEYSLFTA